MFSEDDAENYAPDLFNSLFSKEPTTDEDKPRLADDLDQVYKSLYEQQKQQKETETEENDDDDDDGKDERNPPPPEVQQATTMEQILTEQEEEEEEGEIKPAVQPQSQDSQEQPLPEPPELVFNTPISQQAQ